MEYNQELLLIAEFLVKNRSRKSLPRDLSNLTTIMRQLPLEIDIQREWFDKQNYQLVDANNAFDDLFNSVKHFATMSEPAPIDLYSNSFRDIVQRVKRDAPWKIPEKIMTELRSQAYEEDVKQKNWYIRQNLLDRFRNF
jgi:hypothetical protein